MVEGTKGGFMKALLVVDMLNDYIHREDKQNIVQKTEIKEFVSKCKEALEMARKKKVQVIYSNMVMTKDNPVIKFTGQLAMRATEGALIIPELEPAKGDYISEKAGYDGFWRSDLESILKMLRIRDVYLMGVQTDTQLRETGVTAAHLGFNVTLIEECSKAQNELKQKAAIDFFKSSVGKVTPLGTLDW